MENYLSKNEGRFLQKKFYGDFYIESDFVYHHSLYEARFSRLTWLIGYWQSPLYFQGHKELLMAELMPNSPTSVHYHELATKMKSSDSVALGIRLYEESKNPSDHARGGRIKTISEINLAIDRLLAYRKKAKFFVFCTHKSGLLQKLRLPRDTIFVTPAEGYQDAIACMWLLSNCRHHIMTNSSYYWWGAWLSGAHYSEKDQVILAADNFNNVDGLCNNWQKF